MKDVKKIGHNINLKNIVIHRVVKDSGNRQTALKLATQSLKITGKETLFIGRISDSYYKRSTPTYGIFDDEQIDNSFQNELSDFCSNQTDFFAFSQKSMGYYKKEISKSAPASGGFVVFAFYTNTDKNWDYLLVLTMDNKEGYYVDETNLTIIDIKSLDINKLDVACLINITKWKSIEKDVDKTDKTYLSFVRGNKDISVYFMSFIGCANKTTSSAATKRLVKALDDFCDIKQYDRETKIKVKNNVFSHCHGCINDKKGISLNTISALIDSENPTAFQEFASSEEYGVDAIISGERKELKNIKFSRYKNDDFSIEFDNKLVGTQIIYDKKKNRLTINNIPQELAEQIPE